MSVEVIVVAIGVAVVVAGISTLFANKRVRRLDWPAMAEQLGLESDAPRWALNWRKEETVMEGEVGGRKLCVERRFYWWPFEDALQLARFDLQHGPLRQDRESKSLWYAISISLGMSWLGVSLRPRELKVGDREDGLEEPTGDPAFDQEFVLFGRVGQEMVQAVKTPAMQSLLAEAPMAFEIRRGKVTFYLHHEAMRRRQGDIEAMLEELVAFADRLDDAVTS